MIRYIPCDPDTYAGSEKRHAGSTLSSWQQYMDPYGGANLLFFAAWPVPAACIALYLLRDHDRMLSLGK